MDALMRPGLEVLIKLVVEAGKFYLIRPSGWRW